MRIKKRIFALVMMVVMVFASVSVNAQNTEQQGNEFNDVGSDHWAYEYIQLMTDKGIINGYDDGTFKPSATVSRAEFAKMMVLTLNIEPYSPATATFEDVDSGHWAYDYVESSKKYITYYESVWGNRFKPDNLAVREDMAVAIVRGLGVSTEFTKDEEDELLVGYLDSDEISPHLRKFVAAAIKEELMIGDGKNFSPQGSLDRAQAATLLARLIQEEKVTFEEEVKKTFEEIEAETQKTPTLETVLKDDEVVLEWTEVPSDGFKYYKVVISATDSSPSYPHRGHAVPQGHGTNRYVLESGHSHSGLTLKGGEKYYVAITAVYEGEVYNTSNVEAIILPGDYQEPDESERTPYLEYEIRSEFDDVLIEWSQVDDDNFKYYKVVLSKSDSTPQYPDNGYAKYFSNVSDTRWELYNGDSYNGGDLGGSIKGGETYYVAITAVYHDGKYTSNVKQVTIPGTYEEPDESERTPVLDYTTKDNGVKLLWTGVSSSNFKYYKVVLSKYNSTPEYPDDGYLTYISNASETSYFVQELQSYNGGDFGGQVQDETYYMTVTAVYKDGKYTSNTKVVTVPSK